MHAPTVAAHGDPGHHPVPGADLLEGEVDHHEVDTGELFELGILHAHAGVEHLTEDQDLTGPLREAAQAHIDLEGRKTTGSTVLLP